MVNPYDIDELCLAESQEDDSCFPKVGPHAIDKHCLAESNDPDSECFIPNYPYAIDKLCIAQGTSSAPPVAVDDVYDDVIENTLYAATVSLLANDTDPDGDPLTCNTTPITPPAHGTLVLNSDGTFTYDPDTDYVGPDSFVYEVTDGQGGTDQGTATITVSEKFLDSNASRVGGLANSHHDPASGLGAGKTILSSIEMIRDGVVSSFVLTSAAAMTFKMSLWRDGVRYWLGGEQSKPTGNAVIPCGVSALKGDQIGMTILSGTLETTRYTFGTVKYASDPTASITDESLLTAQFTNWVADIEAIGVAPFLVSFGDSIAMGANSFSGHFDAIMGGDPEHQPGYQVAKSLNWGFENQSDGSQTWAWAATNIGYATGDHASVIDRDVSVIWLHFGVNDIAAGRSWVDVEADMDAVLAAIDPNTRVYLTEILPWTSSTTPQANTVREWNVNYAAWCSGNRVELIACHDAMAQIRPSTGELDDLQAAYDDDGIHLTSSGVSAFASLIAAATL